MQELRERSQRGDSAYNETLDHLLSVVDDAPDIRGGAAVRKGYRGFHLRGIGSRLVLRRIFDGEPVLHVA